MLALAQEPTEISIDVGCLEPDLIGEFFALDVVKRMKGFTLAREFPWLPEAAWLLDGERMEEFLSRTFQNFPEDEGTRLCAITIPGVVQSYTCCATLRFIAPVTTGAKTFLEGVKEAIAYLATIRETEPAAALAFAQFVQLATVTKGYETGVDQLLNAVKRLLTVFPSESALRETWIYSIVNYITSVENLSNSVSTLLMDVKRVVDEQPGEPGVREAWRWALENCIIRTNSAYDEPAEALYLLNELKRLAEAHQDEPHLRKSWATCVFNYITSSPQHASTGGRTLLEELKRVADEHPDEPILREMWATGVFNYLAQTTEEASDPAYSFFNELKRLSEEHPDEPRLRESWARSAYHYVRERSNRDAWRSAGSEETVEYIPE
jgi:hypothetical protein